MIKKYGIQIKDAPGIKNKLLKVLFRTLLKRSISSGVSSVPSTASALLFISSVSEVKAVLVADPNCDFNSPTSPAILPVGGEIVKKFPSCSEPFRENLIAVANSIEISLEPGILTYHELGAGKFNRNFALIFDLFIWIVSHDSVH